MEIRHLTDDDVVEAATVFARSLGNAPKEPERYGRFWDVPASLGAFDERGRVLGVASRFDSRLTLPGGDAVRCAAVPSVGVRADAHGRGVGRGLLARQVREAADRGDAALALNASELWIYGRFGYGPTSTWWSVEADPRNLRWRADAPAAARGSVSELTLDEASEVLPGLYERCFGRWGGELWRHAGYWDLTFHPRADRTPPTVAVHHDATGTPDAAAMFTFDMGFDAIGFANALEVQDLFGLDPAAEGVLARWLCERNLTGKVTAERWSPRSPVPWMLEDARRWRTTTWADAMWVRLVDLPTVVGARPSGGDGAVTVTVLDPLVDANDRTWRLAAQEGRLTCEPVDGAGQVTAGVDLVASMLWGYAVPSTLAAAGRIDAADPTALPVLDRLVAVAEPSWSSTGI